MGTLLGILSILGLLGLVIAGLLLAVEPLLILIKDLDALPYAPRDSPWTRRLKERIFRNTTWLLVYMAILYWWFWR